MASDLLVWGVTARIKSLFPNLDYRDLDNPPELRPPALGVTPLWCALDFPSSAETLAGFGNPGNNLWRETGAFMVHVFCPSGTGGQTARTQADAIFNALKGTAFDGIWITGRFDPNAGPDYGGIWWRESRGISYRHDLTG